MAEERRRISPAVVIGIGAGIGIAAAIGIYSLVKAAPPPPPPPGLATLYGKVTDAVTGEAIPDVLVTLNGGSTYTDNAGAYAFTGVQPGNYTLQFSKEGYEPLVY